MGFRPWVIYKCCFELKKKPLDKWSKENHKPYTITGMRTSEGGTRKNANCLAFANNKLKKFHPLIVVTDEWMEWYINKFNIEICNIYKEPYNFTRTGCKGCPYNLNLQQDLETMREFFPNEAKQCEIIWKPIYNEYRRLGYRLKN